MSDSSEEQPPRKVSVAELLARNAQLNAPTGHRRRRVEPEPEPEPEPELVTPQLETPQLETPEPNRKPDPRPVVDEASANRSPTGAAGVGQRMQLLALFASGLAGAALWLAFRWLWTDWAVAAIVLALALVVGVVVFIRVSRRVEDLLSTSLAVVVVLIVAVSPAAITLVGG